MLKSDEDKKWYVCVSNSNNPTEPNASIFRFHASLFVCAFVWRGNASAVDYTRFCMLCRAYSIKTRVSNALFWTGVKLTVCPRFNVAIVWQWGGAEHQTTLFNRRKGLEGWRRLSLAGICGIRACLCLVRKVESTYPSTELRTFARNWHARQSWVLVNCPNPNHVGNFAIVHPLECATIPSNIFQLAWPLCSGEMATAIV